MNTNPIAAQKGEFPWKWIVAVALIAAAGLLTWRSFVVERAAPQAPELVTPAAGALLDPETSLATLVWRHTEPDAARRDDLQFMLCVLTPASDEGCAYPTAVAESGLVTPAFRRWPVARSDLAPTPVANGDDTFEYRFAVPAADAIPFASNGRRLRWTALACWGGTAASCATAEPVEFRVAGPNIAAASPSGMFSPLPDTDPRSGPLAVAVRAHNTSALDSGPFLYRYRYVQIALDQYGQPRFDYTAADLQPNPRYVREDGVIVPATAPATPGTILGIVQPGTNISADVTKGADIASTVGGDPVFLDQIDLTVTAPVGVYVFLWIDPDEERIELDENDNFLPGLEKAL